MPGRQIGSRMDSEGREIEMSDPLVSIVLTNYNGEKTIAEAIESVIMQTYPKWELIIVDDASTDSSLEIIRLFRDERIQLFRNERNEHVSFSHNKGNLHSKGKYIAALDNDDTWEPEKLSRQVHYMELHPETGVCFTFLDLMNSQGESLQDDEILNIYRVKNRNRIEWLHELLTVGNHFANDSSMIRRSVMDTIGENEMSLVQLHDYDMWVKIALQYELHIIQEPLMHYRRTNSKESITTLKKENVRRTAFEYHWIIGHTILEMEDELFRQVFAKELKKPELTGYRATMCEKAILLCSDCLVEQCEEYGFQLFTCLLQDPECRMLLREQFGIRQQDIYRMTGSPIIFDRVVRTELEQLKRDAEELVKLNQNQIRLMENSFSWRITKPLRSGRGMVERLLRRFISKFGT